MTVKVPGFQFELGRWGMRVIVRSPFVRSVILGVRWDYREEHGAWGVALALV